MKPRMATATLWLATAALPAQQAPAPPNAIAKLATDAAQARSAGRLDDAAKLYGRAVALAPTWEEGWWQVGTIEYARDRYPECRDAFRRFISLRPQISAGYVFLGLCEFQIKEYAAALQHLEKAAGLGLPDDQEVADVALYHLALLQTKAANFERALQFASMLARQGQASPGTIAVAGLAALRRPIFPEEMTEGDRALVIKVGNVLMTGAGRPAEETIKRFEEIAAEFPGAPNVHYTFSTLLLPADPDRAVEELKRELEISPGHVPALVSLSFEYLKRGEPEAAKPYAERAVKAMPNSFAARACLGRVLAAIGGESLNAGITELEEAVRLAPDSPQVHFFLAAAYAKAGRAQHAARERAEVARLKSLAQQNSTLEMK